MERQQRTRTRLDPATRREQILQAASRVFEHRDPAEVTFEEVAEAAQVSRALVYNYFGDRGGLVAALYVRCMQRLDEALSETYRHRASPERRLRNVICCYLDFAERNAGTWSLIGTAEAALHPAVRDAREARYDRMTRHFGSALEIRILARGMLGFLESATYAWLETDRSCDRDTVADTILAAMWSGIAGLGGDSLLRDPRPATIALP